MFPKIIWRYWDQGWDNAPFMIHHCSESVKHYANDFEILDLDRQSVKKYIELPEEFLSIKDFPLTTLADLIRIRLLKKYGGVWIDATVFLNTDLGNFLAPLEGDFFCFWRHKNKITMSNWFLAASLESYIASKTETEFSKILSTSFISDNKKYFKNWRTSPNYFLFHKTFEKLAKSDDTFSQLVHDMSFMESFPILSTVLYGWNKDITNDFASLIIKDVPMIKLSHSVLKECYNKKGHLELLLNKMRGYNNKIYEHNHLSFSLRTTNLYNSFCNTPQYIENYSGPFESESDLNLCKDKYPRYHIYNFPSLDKKFLSQLCIPYGANRLFIRKQDGNKFSQPREIAYKDDIESLHNELLILKNTINKKITDLQSHDIVENNDAQSKIKKNGYSICIETSNINEITRRCMMCFKNELYKIFDELSHSQFTYSINRIHVINYWIQNIDKYVELFYRLEDDESKNTFMKLLKYNIATCFVENSENYSLFSDQWQYFCEKAQTIDHVENDYILDRIETFILDGYSYKDICTAKQGDYVLDCGAYTGNTVLYFSKKVGNSGKVFAFEAMQETYKKLNINISKLNKNNIYTYDNAISNQTKKIYFSKEATPGARAIAGTNGIEVQAISLDSFVKDKNIPHIDFIKMDIEGSELDALTGCAEICRKFKPILAICLYHKKEDFITIPQKILDINKNYKFYLKHNSNSFAETVLFAINGDNEFKYIPDKNEIAEIKLLFDIFKNMYNNKQVMIRRLLLQAYSSALRNICNIQLDYVNDKKWNYIYYPLSDDGKLHYEFLFSGNIVEISLHFEGKYSNNKKIIRDIIESLDLSAEVHDNSNDVRGSLCFKVTQIDNINYIANLMKYLIENSYNILKDNKLISSKYYTFCS